jgi:hypothetical protein
VCVPCVHDRIAIAGLDVSDCVHVRRRLLDDKVMLNELMGGSNPTHERVVPRGFRLPQQYSQLREAAAAAPTARWMLKKGVAHGGNGNRLLAADLDDEDELEGCSDHVVQVTERTRKESSLGLVIGERVDEGLSVHTSSGRSPQLPCGWLARALLGSSAFHLEIVFPASQAAALVG